MKSAIKLLFISLVISIIGFFVNPDLGKLFSFQIPQYSKWLDVGIIVACGLFLVISAQRADNNTDDTLEGWLSLAGVGVIISTVVVIIQGILGGNFVLPVFYISALICSVLSLLFFYSEETTEKTKDFFVPLGVFSGPIFAFAFYAPVVPLFAIFLAPYLVAAGIGVFFMNTTPISEWLSK